MRVVVHHGMSKAGSTALQKGLSRARGALLERGVLYPRAPVIAHSHNLLMAGIVPPGAQPRFLRHALAKAGHAEDGGAALFARWLGAVGESAARAGAETLVLSSENLWALDDPAPFARLRALLAGIGATRIETLAYLRRPSDWSLSAAQQVLAASHLMRPAAPVAYRARLEAAAAGLADPGAARVFRFDRGAFPDGDVLAHFLTEGLGGPGLPPDAAPPREANPTLSAEGMELLRLYRLHNHADRRAVFTEDTRRFRKALDRADPLVAGHARPRMRPETRRRIDQGSEDVAWLREAHGIAFDGIDYDALAPGGWRLAFPTVDALCPVDPERLERLTARTLHELARAPTRRKGGTRDADDAGTGGGDG